MTIFRSKIVLVLVALVAAGFALNIVQAIIRWMYGVETAEKFVANAAMAFGICFWLVVFSVAGYAIMRLVRKRRGRRRKGEETP